jgi:quercetin dioxygenase-like cupin family protein
MEKMLRSAAIFVIGATVGSLTIPELSAQVRALKTTRLITTDLARFCDGKEVVVDYSEVTPGASAKHYHPGYSFGFMIEGSQTSTQEGGPPIVIRKGELLLEQPTQVNVSENSAPAKVVTFRILEKGKPENVRVP